MYPTLLNFGEIFSYPIGIHSYGLMLAIAFITCYTLLQRELNRRNFQADTAGLIIAAAIIGGVIGAKIYFIFLDDKIEIGEIFSPTGLVWYGGLIGGSAAVAWMIHRSRNPFLSTIDIIGPLLLLGYGIGRIGCLLSGDGDYGPPSDVPWAMAFPNGTVPPQSHPALLHLQVAPDVKVHPTPIYETLMACTIFGILWSQRRKFESAPGILFGVSLVMIGVERFIAEFWRLTPRVFSETSSLSWVTMPQVVSLLLFIFGIFFIVLMYKRPRREIVVEPSPAVPASPEPAQKRARPRKRRRRR